MISAKNIAAAALWVITVLWMVFIFGMSAQSGDESGKTSGKVVDKIAETVVPGFSAMTEAEKEAVRSELSFPVRKLAHFTEYGILGTLLTLSIVFSLRKTSVTLGKSAIAAGVGILYAISDEMHQKFVSGRAAMLTDVLIDGSGAVAGCAIASLVLLLTLKKLNRNKDLKDCDP